MNLFFCIELNISIVVSIENDLANISDVVRKKGTSGRPLNVTSHKATPFNKIIMPIMYLIH